MIIIDNIILKRIQIYSSYFSIVCSSDSFITEIGTPSFLALVAYECLAT